MVVKPTKAADKSDTFPPVIKAVAAPVDLTSLPASVASGSTPKIQDVCSGDTTAFLASHTESN
ncbi:hypothetical protein DSO57_1012669 [Entomophthora muscae]|uniref:Uncharacterized protein n=1 Tax=Entomophthora muscae TaxID=34485 RepID=A0ACC2RWX5_9FUNG|nr:hypothetical protein DSO57_1012669 [Entomophthora muscae]